MTWAERRLQTKAALSVSLAVSALLVGIGSRAHAQEAGAGEPWRLHTVTVTRTKRE